MMKKIVTVPIKGMHCASCEVLIGEELESLPDIQKAEVSLRTKSATIYLKQPIPTQTIARAIKAAGYEVGYEEKPFLSKNLRVYKDVLIGLGITAALVLLFAKLGISDLANTSIGGASVGLMALVLGLTAGFSTCMALVGGLVLGVSARHAEKHPTASPMQKFRPHLFFNLGRIVIFTLLGAVIGGIGAAFQLKGHVLGLLTLLVGVVMLILGLQLTELFPRLKGSFALPSGIAKVIGLSKRGEREYSHADSFWIGGLTFFLPCGFTQAMQLLAVSTGSPLNGALIMGLFALGTTPGLLSIGGLTSVVRGVFAQRFFRIVGVIVVMMAFVNFGNAYGLLGLGNVTADVRGLFASSPKTADTGPTAPKSPDKAPTELVQPIANDASPVSPVSPMNSGPVVLSTTYKRKTDIVPSAFTAKVGQKTVLEVDVQEDGSGCMSTIMIPGLDDKAQLLKSGKKLTLTFTATKAGTYDITCAMGIPRGTVKVES